MFELLLVSVRKVWVERGCEDEKGLPVIRQTRLMNTRSGGGGGYVQSFRFHRIITYRLSRAAYSFGRVPDSD